MTILVTGGTGLVGSRLLKRFVEAGIDCRGLVRPGKKLAVGVTALEGDILRPESLAAAVEGVTAIIHLAALFRTGDEAEIWKVNLDGTRNLIAAVKEYASDARFLLASTSNVYDPDISHPGVRMTTSPQHLLTPQAKSKRRTNFARAHSIGAS